MNVNPSRPPDAAKPVGTMKEGKERYTTEIVANEMQMLGSKPGGGSTSYERGGGKGESAGAVPAVAEKDLDDDIPF